MRAGFCDFVLLDPAKRNRWAKWHEMKWENAADLLRSLAVLAILIILLGVVALVWVTHEDLAVGDVHAGDDDSDRVVDGRVLRYLRPDECWKRR